MNRGPKPIPRNLRVIQGTRDNPRKSSLPSKPMDEPAVEIPPAPELLDAEEKLEFERKARELAGMRVMTKADTELLTIWARNWVLWRRCYEKMDFSNPEKMVVRSPKGYLQEHPLYSMAKKAQAACIAVLVEFGCSPSSRNRVSL